MQLPGQVEGTEGQASKGEGGVPAGKAFASLSHHAGVTRAGQLCVHPSVREAAIEEVWPWPAHHELQGVGEDPVEDESKAGS